MPQSKSEETTPVSLKTLWRLGGLSILELVMRTIRERRSHQLDARSAQFSYYSMLALAPLLILIIASVAQLPLDNVLESFLRAIKAGLPDNVVQLIKRQIADIQQHSTWMLMGVALVLLGVAGSRVFLTLGAGLDAAYGVEERRRFFRASAVALALTFGVFVLLLLAMVLLVVGPMVAEYLLGRIDAPWLHVVLSTGVRWGVACGFMLIATSVVYWLVPSVKLPWYWVSPGSLFATVGWIVTMQGMRLYIENIASARYNETYGALGGVVVLLVWLYMTGTLLLTGGQINGIIRDAATGQNEK
ncbi:MAG: YihY/virulence factor BrkB family protein [Planctomycetaceae bacterium]|nr:YihY/virulence factor BrkB family protein [Planctomycetaceae bacterium]MBT6484267.1 YihY/virulence factor BrkB family protein [Planctomycetaceae bacterium]MBT6497442.1 YihY/virulence factor BrkB family protein [Planctomycetaceae bacterium]